MDKKITDLTMEELAKHSWDLSHPVHKKLITSVLDIKRECLFFIEDQFTQQYHDVGDELYDLVERCEGDDCGDEIVRVVREICDKYLQGN